MKNPRGFTMIELLVTVAIIGLLAATVLSALGLARSRARDASRLESLREVRTALETYHSEHGSYPSTSGAWWGACSGFGSHGTSGASGWVPGLAPAYIASLPVDPRPIAPNNCYLYRSDGVEYMVIAYGTVETYLGAGNPAPRPVDTSEADFAFYTPGARNW